MKKRVYHADANNQTLVVPYIPNPGLNGAELPESPSYFNDMYEVPGFYLSDVYGSHLAYIEGEWSEIGFKAVYTRVK